MIRSLLRASGPGLLLAFAVAGGSPARAQELTPADLPGIVIEPPPSPVVFEGASFSVGVKLDAEPRLVLPSGQDEDPITRPFPVTVSFSVTGLTDGLAVTFNPGRLTFDSGNWDRLQQVGVMVGQDDDAVPDQGTFEYTISAPGVRVSDEFPIPITILDDDTPAVTLSPSDIVLIEGGDPRTYEVALAAKPTGGVTVALTLMGAQARQISFTPESLTFTPRNWDEGQTVELSAPSGSGAAPLEGASILHTASGAKEFALAEPAPLSVRVDPPPEPLPPVSDVTASPLPDGFRVSWTPLELGVVAGYRVEFVPWPDGEFDDPKLCPGGLCPGDEFPNRSQRSYDVHGLNPDDVYRVRVMAFEDLPGSPRLYGIPAPASSLVVVGEDLEANPHLSDQADAASALIARSVGSSALEAVAARVAADRESIAHASPATALASWARAVAGPGLSDAVLSVHERSPVERDEIRTRGRRQRPAGPVERGDWSTWFRADRPGLGGRVPLEEGNGTLSLDGSAQVLHLGVERSIEPPSALDRFSEATTPEGEWLAGVGLGLASASVDVAPDGASLDHSTWLVYPYLGYRDDRKLAYASLGGGLGTSTFRHPDFASGSAEQDTLLVFAGLGGAAVVAGRPDSVELLIRASALGTLADTDAGPVLVSSTVAAHRLRFGVDARHARRMGGGILSPSGGIGLLYDAGDGPGGWAVEADAGTRFDWRRFSFSARARTFLKASDDLDRTLGLSGAVRYSPGGSGRGLFFSLSPTYGPGAADGSPWDRVLDPSGREASSGLGLSAEAGYAFSPAPVPGLVTVVAGLRSGSGGWGEGAIGAARAGIRYRGRGSLALGVELDLPLESGGPASAPAVSFRARWSF